MNSRSDIHALLDEALDMTKEGEHFLPQFIGLVLERLTRDRVQQYGQPRLSETEERWVDDFMKGGSL